MPVSPAPRLLVVVSGLVALCGLVGCGSGDGGDPVPGLADDAPRGVVLILVDQLRADTAAAEMPGVMALAERGLIFERMRSTAPWTYPSVLSLFSGLYPQQHGANGTHKGNKLTSFDPAITLLHEHLGAAGFTTAGFVTNPFLNRWNAFHEGFDRYEIDAFINDQGNQRGNRGGERGVVWTEQMFADSVNPEVLAHWSASEPAAHEFSYVHYIDVHGPWDDAPFEGDYLSSTRWIDEKIVELYDFFHARYDGDLLFVITSDHGQALLDDETLGLGEQFRRTKKTMHDFNLRVPLMVLPGNDVPEGARVSDNASNVDVLPTLLDWIGVTGIDEARAQLPGWSWHDAIVAAQEGREPPQEQPERPLYARMDAFKWITDAVIERDTKHVRRQQLAGAPVRRRDAGASFDLNNDPREVTPLGKLLETSAIRALQSASSPRGLKYEALLLDANGDTIGQLEALGYLGSDEDFTGPELHDAPGNDSPNGGDDSDG